MYQPKDCKTRCRSVSAADVLLHMLGFAAVSLARVGGDSPECVLLLLIVTTSRRRRGAGGFGKHNNAVAPSPVQPGAVVVYKYRVLPPTFFFFSLRILMPFL